VKGDKQKTPKESKTGKKLPALKGLEKNNFTSRLPRGKRRENLEQG
jgi:hypothetical protein